MLCEVGTVIVLHFPVEETEAQRSEATHPRSHSLRRGQDRLYTQVSQLQSPWSQPLCYRAPKLWH